MTDMVDIELGGSVAEEVEGECALLYLPKSETISACSACLVACSMTWRDPALRIAELLEDLRDCMRPVDAVSGIFLR